MIRILKGVTLAIVLLVVLTVVVFFVFAVAGPEIEVVGGPQVKKEYLEKMRTLGMLEEGEQLRMFYSDAIYAIEDGFYILSDRKVGIYSEGYSEPQIKLPFDRILKYEVHYSDSFWDDSRLTVFDREGNSFMIPLSSEGGGDKRFVDLLDTELVKRGIASAVSVEDRAAETGAEEAGVQPAATDSQESDENQSPDTTE